MTEEGRDLSAENYRFERKLPLERYQYQDLTAAFIKMGLNPKRTYADRKVQSIYLDTIALDNYQSSVSGLSRRFKIRIRWYQQDTLRLALEIKRKFNNTSTKQIFRIVNPERNIPHDKQQLRQLASTNADIFPTGVVGVYRPVLEVSYMRSYFELSSGIRMTIDREIRYRRLSPMPCHNIVNSPVDYVVEFKYPVGQISAFNALLQNCPFRIFRHSKYVIGLDAVGFS